MSVDIRLAGLVELRAGERNSHTDCGVGDALTAAEIKFKPPSKIPTPLPGPLRVCYYSRIPKLSPTNCRLLLSRSTSTASLLPPTMAVGKVRCNL